MKRFLLGFALCFVATPVGAQTLAPPEEVGALMGSYLCQEMTGALPEGVGQDQFAAAMIDRYGENVATASLMQLNAEDISAAALDNPYFFETMRATMITSINDDACFQKMLLEGKSFF
ncbi:MAG TPA: hypothetical protein V6D29_19845 [Leptolyngbyaceae cyanobacterium]